MFIIKSSKPLWREQMTITDQTSLNDYIEAEKLAEEAERLVERLETIAVKIEQNTRVVVDSLEVDDTAWFFTQARDNIRNAIDVWSQGDDA